MYKTLLSLLIAVLLGMSSVVAQGAGTNTVTWPKLAQERPLGGYNCGEDSVYCVGKDAASEYQVIGGAALQGGTTNAAGSAAAAIVAAAPTPTAPAVLVIGPGLWNEAAVIPSNTSVIVQSGAWWRPTVTAPMDVNGGVLRIAPDTSPLVENVFVHVMGVIQNDAFSSPEAAIFIGGCNGAQQFKNIVIQVDGLVIGHHDGIQWCGGTSGNALPGVTITGTGRVISGADVIGKKGNSIDYVSLIRPEVHTNWCEDPNATVTGEIGPTAVDSGAGSTTSFRLADNSTTALLTVNKISGRRAVFTGINCGPINERLWIDTYDPNTRIAVGHANGGGALSATLDDADCSYTIDAAANAHLAPCLDLDWTPIRAAAALPYWKAGLVHNGVSGPAIALPGDSLTVSNVYGEININDWGPDEGGGCTGQGVVYGWGNISGTPAYGQIDLRNFHVRVNLNADISDSACDRQMAAIYTNDTGLARVYWDGSFIVNNTADDDIDYTMIRHAQFSNASFRMIVPSAFRRYDNPITHSGIAEDIYDFASTAGTLVTGDIISGNSGGLLITTYGPPFPSSKRAMPRDTSRGSDDVDLVSSYTATALDVPAAAMLRVGVGKAQRFVQGIAKGYDGRYFCNTVTTGTAAGEILWTNQDSNAVSQDRQITMTGLSVHQDVGESSCWWYDQTDSRWRMVSFAGDPNS